MNFEARWDDWHYRCSGEDYTKRPILRWTLEDGLADQFARELQKYYPGHGRPVMPADIMVGLG